MFDVHLMIAPTDLDLDVFAQHAQTSLPFMLKQVLIWIALFK